MIFKKMAIYFSLCTLLPNVQGSNYNVKDEQITEKLKGTTFRDELEQTINNIRTYYGKETIAKAQDYIDRVKLIKGREAQGKKYQEKLDGDLQAIITTLKKKIGEGIVHEMAEIKAARMNLNVSQEGQDISKSRIISKKRTIKYADENFSGELSGIIDLPERVSRFAKTRKELDDARSMGSSMFTPNKIEDVITKGIQKEPEERKSDKFSDYQASMLKIPVQNTPGIQKTLRDVEEQKSCMSKCSIF